MTKCEAWDNTAVGYCDNDDAMPCRAVAVEIVRVHLPPHDFALCARHAEQRAKCQTFQGRRPVPAEVST